MNESQSLVLAQKTLLEPGNISLDKLANVLQGMLGKSIDDADLYFQAARYEQWILEEGIVKEGSFNLDKGVGVRAISGEKTGFAYSDEIVLPALLQAASAARSIAFHGGAKALKISQKPTGLALYQPIDPILSLDKSDKIGLLQQADRFARHLDSRVKEVTVSLGGSQDIVMVMRSDGLLAADVRPLIRFNVSVIVEEKGRREQASSGGGGRYDYTYFSVEQIQTYVKEAVREACVLLDARPAPAGVMPVVLGSGWPGVLLHEAIGHGLEGDFNRKGTSAFSGRLGERIATSACTVVDDGTLPGRRGSLIMDDEGESSQCTVLVEDGILKGYMQDRLNAKLMGVASTGNGRRESYSHLPMPRMTNTYMLPGKHGKEEMIASVKKGLYAVNFGGGQVDITSGKFVFSASEAYMIENGKITYPVKGATLIGNGPDVLTKVSMVGNDLALDPGIGVCGKDGQSVPVGVGQPTLLIDELTVGGTAF
jgi:TldD protein